MAITAPLFSNGAWVIMDDNDEGLEGEHYIQAIHGTTSTFQTALWRLADADDNVILKIHLTTQNSVSISFDPPLHVENGFKFLSDPSNSQIYVYLGKRGNVGYALGKTKYPPENGHFKGFTGNRWYQDDVTGRMIPEERAGRDYYERLRDNLDLDEPDTNELREGWTWPTEIERDDP